MTDPQPVTPLDPPGRPRVPRARWSFVAIAYGAIAISIAGAYAYEGMQGKDVLASNGDSDALPASVRSSPGGYRSFAFWHSGYEGGK